MPDGNLSNTVLASKIDNLIQRWATREDQYAAWVGGTATGGPSGDGRYPLTDDTGAVYMIECPARLEADITGIVGGAGTSLGDILQARTDAQAAAAATQAQIALAEQAKTDARAARDLALSYRDQAASTASNIPALATTAVAAAVDAIDLDEALTTPTERSILEFYATSTSTDSEALESFAAQVSSGVIGDCVLTFPPNKGRGPSGRYLVDREIWLKTSARIELDFGKATIRYMTFAAKFRYTAPAQSNNEVNPAFFIARRGVHQYATGVDCLFFWDFPFMSSRLCGTGYAEDMRIQPQQVNSAHTLNAAYRLKNTWYFSATRVHATNKVVAANTPFAGSTFIDQLGVCVVTILDKVETSGFDVNFKPGFAAMTGVAGTFASGTYARGKRLRQGSVEGTFGRNDGAYSWAYSLYDVAGGAFQTGAADVLDGAGLVVGSFNISATGTYTQVSEALQVVGGSTFINCNYFATWTVPANANGIRFIDMTWTDMHVAFYKGCLKVDGAATLNIGAGVTVQPLLPNIVTYEITNGDFISIVACNSITNGNTGCTFARLRNINGLTMVANVLGGYLAPWNTDNTVKDAVIAFNTGTNMLGVGVNTGNRYNATSARGIVFRSNGSMGVGCDGDDPRRISWSPTVTSETGALGSYATSLGWYSVTNGILTFSVKITVTDRGSAGGSMYVSGVPVPGVTGPVPAGYDFLCNGSVGTNAPVVAFFSNGSNRFQLSGPTSNAVNNAFAQENTGGNFVYFLSGSAPIQYN